MGLLKKAAVLVVGLGVIGGGAVYLGLIPIGLQAPEVTVEDIGDWGEVSDSSIEIIHTVGIQNPNSVEANVGEEVTLSMNLLMNDAWLGSISKTGLDIEKGSNSLPIKSELNQDKISEFWANFINEDETIHAELTGDLKVDRFGGFSVSTPPIEVTQMSDEQPISDALNSAADGLEGEYSKSVSSGDLSKDLISETRFERPESRSVKAGYTIENAEVSWGEVDPEETEILIDIEITNSGDVRLPAVPDGIAANIGMNDIRVFEANTEPISLENIDRDSMIAPGETKKYTLVAKAKNENIEEWFTTYARQDEQSSVRTELQFIFDIGDQTFTAPTGGAIAYECSFQTGVFVDGQNSSNNCAKGGTLEIGPAQVEPGELSDKAGTARDALDKAGDRVDDAREDAGDRVDDAREDAGDAVGDNPDQTEEESNTAPTAVADASPQSGEAPLRVTFDGSESSDSDGTIDQYAWQIEGPTFGGEGQTIQRTFKNEGEYEATLVTVDDDGARDQSVITIEVNAESNQAPTAVASADPRSGEAPLDVTFDASGSSDSDGSIDRYIWQIDGAGNGGEGRTLRETFRRQGQYEATLITVDDDGARDTATITVEVEPEPNQAPTAVADVSPQSGEAPLDVTFDASRSSDSDGSIDRYIWRIEGATPGGEGQTIDRTFRTEGEYEATLITVDDDGSRDRASVTVTVERRSLR